MTYLGTDLPASEIANAAAALQARAVAVSVVTSDLVDRALEGLRDLRDLLPSEVTLCVGGRASSLLPRERLPANLQLLESLDQLRALEVADMAGIARA